jgi:SAM-dependent methyltransferase
MSEFPLIPWLALREPLDAASRSFELTRAVAAALPRDRPLRIVDLGCGTGSNARYLEPHLRGSHDWLLVDADPSVLAAAPHQTRCLDLGRRDAPEVFAGRDLVTASALLDLVSEDFLTWLAERCRDNGAVALFALTYIGRSRCIPAEPEDGVINALLNLHQQQSDKGFGPAAGPGAVACAEHAFTAAGFHVRREPSNWHVEPEAIELQELLIQGWVDAALELAPFEADVIHDWHARRRAHLHAGRSRIVVTHEDLAAFPAL